MSEYLAIDYELGFDGRRNRPWRWRNTVRIDEAERVIREARARWPAVRLSIDAPSLARGLWRVLDTGQEATTMISLDRIRNLPGDKFAALVRAGLRDPAVKSIVGEALADGLLDNGAAPKPASTAPSVPDAKRGSRKAKEHGAAKKKAPKATNGSASEKTDESTEKVKEFVLAATDGVSSSVIIKSTRLPKAKVQRALRVLKEAGVLFMGGERRFARWAKTQDMALTASIGARGGS